MDHLKLITTGINVFYKYLKEVHIWQDSSHKKLS